MGDAGGERGTATTGRERSTPRALALSIAGVAVIVVPFALSRIPWLWPNPRAGTPLRFALGGFIAGPALWASATVATVEVAASIAGRGRPAPGARWSWVVRLAVALVGLAIEARPEAFVGAYRFLTVGLGLVAVLACEAAGRARGPSALLGGFGAVSAIHAGLAVALGERPELVADFAAIVAVALALRFLGLDRDRLSRLGVRPWAPGDLALVPAALAGILGAAGAASRRPLPFIDEAWFEPALALLVIGALAYLRSLDRRTSHQSAAQHAAPATSPPSV
ncbi:MAG TPA: hypothetical protein VHF22_13790 [Planctomycetota bacterium]|nr:hypothetical protein [Planctomycetota bacterium]